LALGIACILAITALVNFLNCYHEGELNCLYRRFS
jgi:hypothetical protein